MKLTIFIDGASRGNPGRSAIGVALYDPEGQSLKEIGLEIGITTNNIAEYTALLYGLGETLLYLHKLLLLKKKMQDQNLIHKLQHFYVVIQMFFVMLL